jgi:hypothetical protein
MTTAASSRMTIWPAARPPLLPRARRYFASDSRRTVQTVLGLIWLLDGALQFQPYMYGNGFIRGITGLDSGQPHWLVTTINWSAHVYASPSALFNTLAALIQVLIGLGLVCRRTVKPAIAVSIAWALVVWWSGEGFGMLLAGSANPLTGAPGAVVLYAIIALLVWPNERPGGLLGIRGARVAWGALWLVMAWAWLLPANSGANATASAIKSAPGGGWLLSLQSSAASGAKGHGAAIAIVLALVSAAIGVAVATNWRPRPFLVLAIVLNAGYWVIGQGFGGVFYTNSATDLNSGPLFVLLAVVLLALVGVEARTSSITGVPVQRRPAPVT